jgi:hypothetical protein
LFCGCESALFDGLEKEEFTSGFRIIDPRVIKKGFDQDHVDLEEDDEEASAAAAEGNMDMNQC